jgi:hypothetical protein
MIEICTDYKKRTKDYLATELQIQTYWRWGAFYLLTFTNKQYAFVSIDFSYEGREYCSVDSFYDSNGNLILENKDMTTRWSFAMSKDELESQKTKRAREE